MIYSIERAALGLSEAKRYLGIASAAIPTAGQYADIAQKEVTFREGIVAGWEKHLQDAQARMAAKAQAEADQLDAEKREAEIAYAQTVGGALAVQGISLRGIRGRRVVEFVTQ